MMRRMSVILLVVPAACLLGGEAFAGRPHRDWGDRVRKEIKREVDQRDALPGLDPIKWMTDFDEAAALAAREKRGMVVLFTTEDLARTSPFCTFNSDKAKKAVSDCNAVPVRIMPPVMLDDKGVPPEEARKRREEHARAQQCYAGLVKRFGVNTGPVLVLAAPDAVKLTDLVTPNDDQIAAGLGRLPEMLQAHEKAAAGKAPDARPPAGDPKAPAADQPKDAPKPEPKAEPKPKPANPEDDF
jgi:hypothetical protein